MSLGFSMMVLVCFGIPLVLFAYAMTHSWLYSSLVVLVVGIAVYFLCREVGRLPIPKNDIYEIPLNEHVEGCLDEVSSGLTHRFAKDIGKFTVFQGSRLTVQGWIGSTADLNAPIRINLVTQAGQESGLEFMVLPKHRCDVADAKKNLDFLNSGFVGTVTIPKEFLPGTYLLRVEKGAGSKRQFFIPATEIEVVPSNSPGKS